MLTTLFGCLDKMKLITIKREYLNMDMQSLEIETRFGFQGEFYLAEIN